MNKSMKYYVLHKNQVTSEDVLLCLSAIIVIILMVKTELYLAYAPILFLFSIGLLVKIILFFKWQSSYAIKLTSEHIVLNHTLLYNKFIVPLSSISFLNKEKMYIELKEECNIRVPGFGKGKKSKISLSSLSDSERKEIFDKMEDFGIIAT